MDSFLVTMVGGGKPPPPSYHPHRDENYKGQRISQRLPEDLLLLRRDESKKTQKNVPHDGSTTSHKKPPIS